MIDKIVFEASATQIYQRIILAFSGALGNADYKAIILKPDNNRPAIFAKRINNLNPKFVFITNPHSLLSHYSREKQKCYFELIKSHLVFIHHDNFFGPIHDPDEIRNRFEAFRRVADNSTHFCIENSNIVDLENLSIPGAYKIFHATEFTSDSTKIDSLHNCSFVGHVLQYNNQLEKLDKSFPMHQQIATDFSMRLERQDYNIGKSAEHYADCILKKHTDIAEWTTQKQLYKSFIHNTSLRYRGNLLQKLADNHCIDIIGGDPSYIHGATGDNRIEHHNLHYHAPTKSPIEARDLYAQSKINLNITPLQFDSAIINRVMDIGGSGGFPLTDWKDDMADISVHDQITYRTIDELSTKIDYYLTHERERREIASQLHHEIKSGFTYRSIVKSILDKIT